MKYSMEWLISEIEKSRHFDYLFFWGHTPKKEGEIDKSCLSQWYPSSFTVDGINYATAEHWMMAKKALLFNDKEVFQKIVAAKRPKAAKALGREVSNFDATNWNASSYSIVVKGNLHKFLHNEELKGFLLQTKDNVLVEASPNDAIWGIGLSQDDTRASRPFQWRGTNWLGFALMEVRDGLR